MKWYPTVIFICISLTTSYFKTFIYLFIHFKLHWGFVALHGFSLVAASWGYDGVITHLDPDILEYEVK